MLPVFLGCDLTVMGLYRTAKVPAATLRNFCCWGKGLKGCGRKQKGGGGDTGSEEAVAGVGAEGVGRDP